MNLFLNHALTSLNTAQTPQNIFLMITKKHILKIWNMLYKSPSNSPSVQVLHQQMGGGSRPVLILLTQGEGKIWEKHAYKILEHALKCYHCNIFYIFCLTLIFSARPVPDIYPIFQNKIVYNRHTLLGDKIGFYIWYQTIYLILLFGNGNLRSTNRLIQGKQKKKILMLWDKRYICMYSVFHQKQPLQDFLIWRGYRVTTLQ